MRMIANVLSICATAIITVANLDEPKKIAPAVELSPQESNAMAMVQLRRVAKEAHAVNARLQGSRRAVPAQLASITVPSKKPAAQPVSQKNAPWPPIENRADQPVPDSLPHQVGQHWECFREGYKFTWIPPTGQWARIIDTPSGPQLRFRAEGFAPQVESDEPISRPESNRSAVSSGGTSSTRMPCRNR